MCLLWLKALNRKFLSEFQLSFAQLEASAAQVTLRSHRQHHEVVATQNAHHEHRAFQRDDELAQTAEPRIHSRTLRASYQRRELRGRNIEIRFHTCLAEHLFNGDTICSHDERTEAALGAVDDGLKHFFEHMALQLRTLTTQHTRPRRVRAGRTRRQRSTEQLRLRSRSGRLRLCRWRLQLSRRRRIARRVSKRNRLRNRRRTLTVTDGA